MTLNILLHVKGSSVIGRQSRFEFSDVDGAIVVCVEGSESVLNVFLGQYLLMVDSGRVELHKVYLAISIKITLFENIDPFGFTELETIYLVLCRLQFIKCKMSIMVSIHLLEGGFKLLKVMPISLEAN